MKKNFYQGKFTQHLSQKNWFISLEGKSILPRKKGARFIVIEGLDGSGQTTQAILLKKFLIEKGYKVLKTKEPTENSQAGKLIREVLDKKKKISPKKLQELFTRDRKEHLENLIIPALEKGKIVVSDRYFFSTFAYGMADGLDLQELIKTNNKFLLPDLTLILKVKPEICIKRIEQRGNRKTLFEKKEKLKKVYKNYLKIAKKFVNVKIINSEKSIKKVFEEVKKVSSKINL